jgi:hypothetical protein
VAVAEVRLAFLVLPSPAFVPKPHLLTGRSICILFGYGVLSRDGTLHSIHAALAKSATRLSPAALKIRP